MRRMVEKSSLTKLEVGLVTHEVLCIRRWLKANISGAGVERIARTNRGTADREWRRSRRAGCGFRYRGSSSLRNRKTCSLPTLVSSQVKGVCVKRLRVRPGCGRSRPHQSARVEVLGRLAQHDAHQVGPSSPPASHFRFAPILFGQHRHRLGVDIGRVGNDQVVTLAGNAGKEVEVVQGTASP